MKCLILISSILLGSISTYAQSSLPEYKSRVRELNTDFKVKAKQLRRDYDTQRRDAHDSEQDALEEVFWKNKLLIRKEKKRFKRELKSNPFYEYQFSDFVVNHQKVLNTKEPIEDDLIIEENELIASAQMHLGVPYRYGGSDRSGFDCSGFVQHVFNKAGFSLPRTSSEQSKSGKKVSLKELEPGDLIFFSHRGIKIDHVGIVTSTSGDQIEMIHSSSSSGIVITNVSQSSYWRKRLRKARRIS
ncbi:MAG: C40 family peptidase [Flavobacteriales bacterium]|nr:C40 family peptidase [Flavobacteriales bacterium]